MIKFKRYNEIDEVCEACDLYEDLMVEEATYEGKKVKLNDPIRTSENPDKKFKVYVKNEKGNVVVVRFGDPNMEIKRDDPDRRKSFRQDTTAITQVQNGRQGIGPVTSGALEQRSITDGTT